MGKYLITLIEGAEGRKVYMSDLSIATEVVTAATPCQAARVVAEKTGRSQSMLVDNVNDEELMLCIVDLQSLRIVPFDEAFADDLRVRRGNVKAAIDVLEAELARCEKTLRPLEKIKMPRLESLQQLQAELSERISALRDELSLLDDQIVQEQNRLSTKDAVSLRYGDKDEDQS